MSGNIIEITVKEFREKYNLKKHVSLIDYRIKTGHFYKNVDRNVQSCYTFMYQTIFLIYVNSTRGDPKAYGQIREYRV